MDKETRTGRTGQGSASGRSSPGSKLKTEENARKLPERSFRAKRLPRRQPVRSCALIKPSSRMRP